MLEKRSSLDNSNKNLSMSQKEITQTCVCFKFGLSGMKLGFNFGCFLLPTEAIAFYLHKSVYFRNKPLQT